MENSHYDDLEKKYNREFVRECKKHNLKGTRRDDEGIPTLRANAKKNPWYCQPWGPGQASLQVFDAELSAKGETLHGKTLTSVLRKFLKYVPDYRATIKDLDDPGVVARLAEEGVTLLCGDTEGTIVFPLSKLRKVARHFGFNKKRASEAQLAHRAKFGQMMKDRKEEEENNG